MLIWIIKARNYAAKLDCFCSYASVLYSSCSCHGSHNRLKGPFMLQEVDKVSLLSLTSRVAWKWGLDAWASVFFPCLREPSEVRQADQMLARADQFHQQVLTKAGIIPPPSSAVWEERPSYSRRWLLAQVQLFSAVLQLVQAGEVLVTEVV